MTIKNSYLLKMYNMLDGEYHKTRPTDTQMNCMITHSIRMICEYTMNDIVIIDNKFINKNELNTENWYLTAFFMRYMMAHDDTMTVDNRWQEFDHEDEAIVEYSNEACGLIKDSKMTDEYMTEFMVALKLMY